MPIDGPPDGAQAIRRALDVARQVAQLQRSGATLARVSKATGLNRSTAFRILRSLTDERMLHFRQADHSYHIGPLAYELGLAAGAASELREDWRGTVERIAARTGLTGYLMARSGDEAVCLLCVQGTATVRAMPVEVGQRVPLGIGAGGLVLLSALDDDEVRRIAASHRKRLAEFPSQALSLEQIAGRVALTRARGFSISSGTVASGISGVGISVPAAPGPVQLALTVSAVTEDICEKEARSLADAMAAECRKKLPADG